MRPIKMLNTLAAAVSATATLCALPAVAQPPGLRTVKERFATGSDIIVVAHRGCHSPMPRHGAGAAPENSLLALDRCVEIGVDVMETDVVRTADGYLVMIHDDTVDRTTDGTGRVADMTLADVRKLRLRQDLGGAGAAITDQRVVTLDGMLAHARGRILLNLDIKASIYPQVIEAVRRAGALDYVCVKTEVGVDTPALASVAPFDRVPFMPILLNAQGKADLAGMLERQLSGARPIGVELPKLSESQIPPVVTAAKRRDVRLMLNTLGEGFLPAASDRDALRSPASVWGGLARLGISVFQTDEPEALVAFRSERAPTQGTDRRHS
jgi:glycerophosphoryl diester phosphodiesterase